MNDLPEIIRMGREKGLHFSIEYQWNPSCAGRGYARKLKKAGLNTVFLQFDGVSDDGLSDASWTGYDGTVKKRLS